MTQVIRHGGEAHVVRPDRVYRTGVLTPMVGFAPGADVQANAQAFTQGPPLGTMLQGLGAFGPFQRLGLRIKSWWAQRKGAGAFMNTGVSGFGAPGLPYVEAHQVAPQLMHQMQMLMHLPARGSEGAAAAYAYADRRWDTYYRAG